MVFGWLGWRPDSDYQLLPITRLMAALVGVHQKYPHLPMPVIRRYPDRDFLDQMCRQYAKECL